MLAHRLRRWTNITPALGQSVVFAGIDVISILLNPLTAKLFNLNFRPPEVVSRWRDPQLQVSKNYLDLTKWRSNIADWCHILSL